MKAKPESWTRARFTFSSNRPSSSSHVVAFAVPRHLASEVHQVAEQIGAHERTVRYARDPVLFRAQPLAPAGEGPRAKPADCYSTYPVVVKRASCSVSIPDVRSRDQRVDPVNCPLLMHCPKKRRGSSLAQEPCRTFDLDSFTGAARLTRLAAPSSGRGSPRASARTRPDRPPRKLR